MLKLKGIIIAICFIVTAIYTLSGHAYTIESNESGATVDKFKPSAGTKVKFTSVADKVESLTAEATNKKKKEKRKEFQEYKRQPFFPKDIINKPDKFRWF